MTKLKEVEAAIFKALHQDPPSFETAARAAVEAMRVPPIEAPAAWEWRPTMDEAWRVYIDAILNEKPVA